MLSKLDSFVIIGYLMCMLLVGYLSGKGNKNQDDYLVASRSMPWIPVALSVAATMISANGFIGGPGWAYESGMYPVMVNIAVPFAVFFALYITTPIIYHLNISSIYQYMGMRLGKYCRALALFQFFVNAIIQASSMVFVPTLILQKITGWSLLILVPLVVLIATIYTLIGGIKAVIWTDAIQMFVVIGAVILVIVTAMLQIKTEPVNFFAMLKESGKLATLDFSFDISNNNTFWVTLIGGSFMWIRYFCFDQTQVQRILTSKSLTQAKRSLVLSAAMMNIVYYLMLFVGVILFFFYKGRNFESSNDVMITFILNEIPKGIIGVIIAGVFAAAMSSVDSLINSMTYVFTKDIYEPCFGGKQLSLKNTMCVTAIISVTMTAVILIGFGSSVRSILDLVGNYISYFSGPAAGAFLLGLFTRKAHDRGVAIGIILGIVGNIAIAITLHTGWLWNPAIGATITIIVGYISSCLLSNNNQDEQGKAYTAVEISREIKLHKSMRPYYFGFYESLVLGFFFLQYIFLYQMQF